MNVKTNRWKLCSALATVGMFVTIFHADQAHAATANGQVKKSVSLASLPSSAVAEAKNILVYDTNGKIVNEYHSDGTVVNYKYGSDGKMTESQDNKGFIQKYRSVGDHMEISDYLNGKLIRKIHSAHHPKGASTQALTPEERKALAAKKWTV